MATAKATHKLARAHHVIFDPARHFVDGPSAGDRLKLPAGTHVIPGPTELANLPDRFIAFATPDEPAERELDEGGDDTEEEEAASDEEADSRDEDEGTEQEESTPDAEALLAEKLDSVNGNWSALTKDIHLELAEAFGLGDCSAFTKAQIQEMIEIR